MKADLKRLNECYLKLPESMREEGVTKFARHPPADGDYLTAFLWREFLRPEAMEDKDISDRMDAEQEKKIIEEFKAFREGENVPAPESWSDEHDTMSVERRVTRRKGTWYQVPKDLPDQE